MRAILAIAMTAALIGGCSFGTGRGSGPVNPGTTDCIGLPREICAQVAEAVAATRSSDVTGYRVSCADDQCTALKGNLEFEVLWSDSTRTSSTIGWANGFNADELRTVLALSGRAIPTPPVAPVCIRLAPVECQSYWLVAMENVPAASIDDVVRVIVECTSTDVCTSTSGEGQVKLEFRNGTSIVESTWGNVQRP